MENKRIGIGIIGYGMMGRVHSGGFAKLPVVYSSRAIPILKGLCGRTQDKVREVAKELGYEYSTTNWKELITDEEVQIIDNCAPDSVHLEPCIAALETGKHTIVEKPMAMNLEEALQMYEAARKAEHRGVRHMVFFCYRFVPAILLAKRLINEGRLGKIYQFRSCYIQDRLVEGDYPLTWRSSGRTSASGVHGDLNSHSIDMARFLVGEVSKISAWTGIAGSPIFIKRRLLPIASQEPGGKAKGRVDVPDVAYAWLQFENGAMGSLEASCFSTGCKSVWRIEVHGSEGAIAFDQARMNELNFYSRRDSPPVRGFRKILVTDPQEHEFVKYYSPAGQTLAWEHCHYNAILHFFDCVVHEKDIAPYGASFLDGMRCQEVLEAGLLSARRGTWVEINEMRQPSSESPSRI